MSKFNLGDKLRDQVTGFEGIALCQTNWLHGCTRWGLQSDKLDKDGKPGDVQMFDEPQLVLVKAKKVNIETRSSASKPGGPRPRIEFSRN